jgi:ethanolaminephosphotransferase
MLIDHGMDSITTVIMTLLTQVMVQVGSNFDAVITMVSATLPFYFAIIEQYYTGELVLPEINGIDEGSLVYIFLCLLAGYIGPKTLFLT